MSTDTREALPPLPKKRRAMFCTKCGFSGPTEAEASPQGAPCQRCSYTAFVEELDYGDDEMQAYARAALATQPAQPSAQGEAVAHPSHQTVRDWMPVNEALRLADVWSVGDLDNCGQWRAAIKVLADEVRALASAPAAQPSAQGEADAWRNVLQTLLDIWHCGHLTIRPEAEGYWLTTVEAGEAILGRLDQLASAPAAPAQPSAQGEAVAQPENEHDCPTCGGEGIVRRMTSHLGPDDYEYDDQCQDCAGSGSANPKTAIESLPYSLHRVRGCQVIERAAVLRIIEAHLASAPAAPAQAVPLTDHELWANDDLMAINAEAGFKMQDIIKIARAIERAHGIAPKAAQDVGR